MRKRLAFPVVFLAFVSLYFVLFNWTSSYTMMYAPVKQSTLLLDGDERVIVTLTRTSAESKGRLKNMLASIQKFYTNKYKIVVFCDIDYNDTHQAEIRKCTDLNVIFYKIDLFEYMEKNITLAQAGKWIAGQDGGIKGRKLGYRLLCRFWAVGVFWHPLFRHVKFLMRMDDDSYFTAKLEEDPFDTMERDQLDYGYRAWFGDGSLIHGLWDHTKAFVSKQSIPAANMNAHGILNSKGQYTGRAVYNNFFVARTEAWRRPVIQSYLDHLVDKHAFLKFKNGDANVHAMAITLGMDKNKTRQFNFSYSHNAHVFSKSDNLVRSRLDYRQWLKTLKCRHIARINLNKTVTLIKL